MTSHKVLVQPSGRAFAIEGEQSVLAAALAAGITLPHGCKNGACGACKGKVLSGRVHHTAHSATALSHEEYEQGLALFCCAHPEGDLVIEARVAEALDGVVARKMPGRIEHIEWPAKDVAVLTMKLPANDPMLFRCGQYVDFILPNGVRRSYSIASPQGTEGRLEFHIRHMPGGTFTDALFGTAAPVVNGTAAPAVKERAIVRLEGPLGTFYLREDSNAPIVLLASGTGFAPIKSIVETIFAKGLHRDDPASGRRGRPVVLYWGARTRPDLYLDALPQRWQREEPNFRYVPVLSEPVDDPAAPEQNWTGRTGFVHEAVMTDLPDLSAYQVYACGVPIMVQSAHRDFVQRCGLREENFFSDAFVSRADLAKPVTD